MSVSFPVVRADVDVDVRRTSSTCSFSDSALNWAMFAPNACAEVEVPTSVDKRLVAIMEKTALRTVCVH